MKQRENVIDGILDILCDQGVIDRDDTAALKQEFKNHEAIYFEDYLIDEDIVDKDDILQALEQYYGVQAVDVMGEILDHNLLVMFPKDVLHRLCCIPYRQDGQLLFVVTNDPTNEELDSELGQFVSYDFEYFVGIPRHIDMMIKDFYEDVLYQDDYEDTIDKEQDEREIVEVEE